MKKLFYKVHTTGLQPHKHYIHRILALYEEDGRVADGKVIDMCPHPKAIIDKQAIEISGKTMADLMGDTKANLAIDEFNEWLLNKVDRFDRSDRIQLIGYNVCSFDERFLSMAYALAGIQMASALTRFSIDVKTLAGQKINDAEMAIIKGSFSEMYEIMFDEKPEYSNTELNHLEEVRRMYRTAAGYEPWDIEDIFA